MATINWNTGGGDDPWTSDPMASAPLDPSGSYYAPRAPAPPSSFDASFALQTPTTTPTTTPALPTATPASVQSPAMETYTNQTDARNAWFNAGNTHLPAATMPTTTQAPGAAAVQQGGDPQSHWQQWYQSAATKPRQSQNTSLQPFVDYLKQRGINAEVNVDPHGYGKGINLNGQFVKLLDGNDNPIWMPGGGEQGGAGGPASSYMAQFSDPSTKLLEQYVTRQMGLLDSQQAAQQQANEGLKARMPDIQAATDRLVAYLNSRATQLQGAPYTGTEQEILRTQALDPIERDRTAANKRALEQIGARGLTPESGIAMDLQNQVNGIFDRQRAGAQGDLAYKTINEQRSRQQEAQQLLGLVPSVQRAAATGDLSFLQALDAAVNQPGQQAINLATVNQRLPSQAMNDALAVMGQGPGADSIYNQALGLYNTQSQNSNQSQYAWGQMLAYLLGGQG